MLNTNYLFFVPWHFRVLLIAAEQQTNYGTLGPLVKTVGWLVSATAAIIWSFRGRARWEPSEEDVSNGPGRVAGVLTAVGIAILWTQLSSIQYTSSLVRLAILFAIGTVIFLLGYGFLVGSNTYQRELASGPNQTRTINIIGGFWLTGEAKKNLHERAPLTVQNLLRGAGNDPDLLWSKPSRALAKLFFNVGYIGLTVCGSIALVCAAILLILFSQS